MLNFFYKNIKNKKGFTLVELIIVIAIIGILAAIAVPRFSNVSATARRQADLATAKTIADAAAVAIANGDIALPASGVTKSVDIANDLVAHGYLDKTPVPQVSGNSAFAATVSDVGTVIVYYGSSTGTQVYPKP